jgi:hypothetical protein
LSRTFGISFAFLQAANALTRGKSDSECEVSMIRKLKSGQYRLYSRKKSPATGKRRNLGTFPTLEAAERHERQVQFFKRRG